MTDSEQGVWKKVDQQREVYIGFLQELVRASESGEEATQQRVADEFKTLGCDVEVIRCDPRSLPIKHEFVDLSLVDPGERISVVGRLSGAGGGRSILFWAHPDSSPVTGTEAWQHAPFAGEIENGRLYGWGVSDDLIGVAIMACALEAVLAAGLKPKGEVLLASIPSKRHAQGIIAVLERGYVADASIYLHPAESGMGLKDIKAVTSGSLRFRITVPGRPPDTTEPGHAVFYHLAINPIGKAWVVYQALQALAEKRAREIHYPMLEKAIGRSTNLDVTYIRCGDENRLRLVSPECVLAGSALFPPGEKVEDVQSQIIEAVQTAANSDDWLKEHPPQVEWLRGVSRGTEVPVDHPLYQTVSQAIVAVTGSEPRNYPLHPTSDIRNPTLHKGIPTVGFGPLAGDSTQIGGHDEWVDVEDYIRAVKVVGSIILGWCGV
jgi:acetylornithine deacetylase